MKRNAVYENALRLCTHRGFVFPSSSLYGGLANTYDYGPLGNQMKMNIQNAWYRDFVQTRMNVHGIDSATILNPKVWEASGHLDQFTDPMVVCKSCSARSRVDKLFEEDLGEKSLKEYDDLIESRGVKCPGCGKMEFEKCCDFNLLFETSFGSNLDTRDAVYLRPETAQGAYINFENVQKSMRQKMPFGIGQMGKSYRNEISPGQFIFRTREFEQMELQYFCHPKDAVESFEYWQEYCYAWLVKYGIRKENLNKRVHAKEELAHYATATTDIEYNYHFGWGELWGIANRGDFDFEKHMKASKSEFAKYVDPLTNEEYVPHVIEPAVGVGRILLAMIMDAYHVENVNGRDRVVLKLHSEIAPYQLAILPISNKPQLIKIAETLVSELATTFRTTLDTTASIGKRYRRQDEIGTPLCLTIDFDSIEDECFTIRDRDTMEQLRLNVHDIKSKNFTF